MKFTTILALIAVATAETVVFQEEKKEEKKEAATILKAGAFAATAYLLA